MALYPCLLVFNRENDARNSYSEHFRDKMRLYKCTVCRNRIDTIVVCVLSCVINDKLLKKLLKRGEQTSGPYYTMVLKVSLESIFPSLLLNTTHDDIFWLSHRKSWDTLLFFQINDNKEKTYLECHSYNKHLR